MKLEGRSAVVSGGGGGLGSAAVRRIVAAGGGAVVLDVDPERANALADELGPQIACVIGDSKDDDAVAAAIAAARELGTFSIALSATSVVIHSQPLVAKDGSVLSRDALQANLDLHVVGPFNLARLCAAAFTQNEPDGDGQRGVIVQTASISAFDGQMTMVPYAAAKGAIVSMTLPMARDLAMHGIRVCSIAPGSFLTPMLAHPEIQAALLPDINFPKRVGDPDEYASLFEQIVTNPYLNGEVIRIDGGARLGKAMGRR